MEAYKSIESIPSRYEFVHVVARRARKLQGGARPVLPTSVSRKPTRVAQQEVMEGAIEYYRPGADEEKPGAKK